MLKTLYFILSIILAVDSHNKKIFNISIFLLVILFCFCGEIADRENYERWFEYFDYSVLNNIGFYFVVQFVEHLGLGIQGLYILIGVLFIGSLAYIISKKSVDANFVLSYYMIGLFFLDVVQLKNTLGHLCILWALFFYFTISRTTVRNLVYIGFVVLGVLIHPSLFYYLILLFIRRRPKTVFIISIVISIVISISFSVLYDYMALYFGRMSYEDGYYSSSMVLLMQLIIFLFFAIVYVLLKTLTKRRLDADGARRRDILLNTISVMIPLISLVQFSIDFRRMFFFMSLFSVLQFVDIFKKQGISLNMCKCLFVAYSFLLLYFFSMRGNMDTVLSPIFDNNRLIALFS